MRRTVWEEVPVDAGRVQAAIAALGVPPVIARLLCQRGLDDPADARRFLSPELSHLHDPYLLAGIREAVERIRAAVSRPWKYSAGKSCTSCRIG